MRRWSVKLMRDQALMQAYASGNSHAFEELYCRHKSAVIVFLRRQSDNRAVCEELAHDTWLAVINQVNFYQPSAKFKTWLFRIAHNRLVDHWRKHGRSAGVLFEELNEASLKRDDQSSREFELKQLLKLLDSLSPEQTETMLLKIEGFSHAEIAEITGAKSETVKSRLRYATQHLKGALEAVS